MTGSLPDQVLRGQRLAETVGFPLTGEQAGPGRASACLPGVGRFLATLAAGCGGGMIAELGTGVGIGTAWLSGAMPTDCRLVTAEIDERLAAAARQLIAGRRPRGGKLTSAF